jgi:dethiobiotin synthetase/adenosylmethionine--8-amino-7-oxononanoate aminotransferase
MLQRSKIIHSRCIHKKIKFFTTPTKSSNINRITRPFSSTSSLPSLPVSKKHPTHIIFGANTDVGKTVLSTTLVRSNVLNNDNVNYIKPLQCGGGDESFLNSYVKNITNGSGKGFDGHTLFTWEMPASPHLASRKENKPISDEQVLMSLQAKINDIHDTYKNDGSMIWIETAGGVLSPSSASPYNTRPRHAAAPSFRNSNDNDNDNSQWGWSTQGDLYQPLHTPVVLVGDGRLGGISATLSALESLLTRGYDVHAIALIEDYADTSGHGSNLPALKEYASRCMALRSGNGRSLLQNVDNSIVSFPALPADMNIPLNEWFELDQVVEGSANLNNHLRNEWEDHIDSLEQLRDKGLKNLWWPFTQHQGHHDDKVKATLIDGASGDNFSILQDSKTNDYLERTDHFDACASWWTQGMGHGESSMGLAAAAAAGRFGHVIFPDVVHEPATELADRLVNSDIGPGKGWASRVFFSDDGSTAMEVAIKMGMKKFTHDRGMDLGGTTNNNGMTLTVCAQEDCYHGDTLGVMDVAEPSIFNEGQHPWYESRGLFLAYPTVRYKDGLIGLNFPSTELDHGLSSMEEVFDVNTRLSSKLYQEYFDSIQHEWDSYETEQKSR